MRRLNGRQGRWPRGGSAAYGPLAANCSLASGSLVTSLGLQDLWLRTDLAELVEHTNKQLKVKPFRREPP